MTAEPTLGPDQPRSRRQVLCGLAVALLAPGAVVAACSSGSGGDAGSDAGSDTGAGTSGGATGGASATTAPGKVLAKVADVPVGGGVLVDMGSRKLLLVQPKKGTVKAFDPTCPHQGFTVNPPLGGIIVCPGHGSTFDASTGAVKTGPAFSGLAAVAVKVSGGNVVTA